jgi:hypothetical protein
MDAIDRVPTKKELQKFLKYSEIMEEVGQMG